MAKRIKLPGRAESAEVGGVVAGANTIYDDVKGKMQDVVNSDVDAELVRLEESKQDNLTFDNAPTEGSQNPVTSAGVYTADKALSDAIEAILLLIPSAASALNQLADKTFVRDSISMATATPRGTFNVVTDLHLSVNATHTQIEAALDELSLGADQNDYCFVQIPDEESTENIKKTERYKFNGTGWVYEYDLNNSGFTSDQWAAINSNITALLVAKLVALPTADVLAGLLAGKQDSLTFDDEPTAGSINPVTSGGIHTRNNEIVAMITALEAAKQNVLTFDSTPVNGSENPVMSGGVYDAIYLVQVALAGLDGRMLSAEHSIEVLTENVGILRTLYQALSQSDIIVGAKPTTGVANKVYRVPGTSTYADWMYYGGAWVKLAEYTTLDGYLYKGIATPNGSPAASAVKMFYFALTPGTYTNFGNLVVKYGINILKYDGANWTLENLGNSDGVFDVTEYSGSSFASLKALLSDENLSNLIPVGVRKGGMSIKFVCSSDNKYIQYRYMSTSTSNANIANVSNWQGVETEPTDRSRNLVESGAIYRKTGSFGLSILDEEFELGDINHDTGRLIDSETVLRQKNFNDCVPLTVYKYDSNTNSSFIVYYYDKNKEFLGYRNISNHDIFVSIENAHFFKLVLGSAYGVVYLNDIVIFQKDNWMPNISVLNGNIVNLADRINDYSMNSILDEQFELGDIRVNGVPTSSTETLRTVNFSKCYQNTEYKVKSDNISLSRIGVIYFYDNNYKFIEYKNITKNEDYYEVISSNNAGYFKIVLSRYYGTTYNNDVNVYQKGGIGANIVDLQKFKLNNFGAEIHVEWETGDISIANGSPVMSQNVLRTKNYINCSFVTLTIDAPVNSSGKCGYIFCYDKDYKYLGYSIIEPGIIEPLANSCFLKLELVSAYGNVYKNDVNIKGEYDLGKGLSNIEQFTANGLVNNKHLLSVTWELGDISIANGKPSASQTTLRAANFVNCTKYSQINVEAPQGAQSSTGAIGYIFYYNASKTFLGYDEIKVGYVGINKNASFFKIVLASRYGTTYNNDINLIAFYKNHPFRYIVSKDGSGDFDTVTEAVDNCCDGDAIFIKCGIYDNEEIETFDKNLIIIGEDKYGVQIKGGGDYDSPPLEMASGMLKNVSVYAYGNTPSQAGRYAYAIHADNEILANNTFIVEDCILRSNKGYGVVGMGLRGGCRVLFKNCDFIADNYAAFFMNEAVTERSQTGGDQYFEFNNCKFICNGEGIYRGSPIDKYLMAIFEGYKSDNGLVYATFINNVFVHKDIETPRLGFIYASESYLGDSEIEGNIIINSQDEKMINWFITEQSFGNNISSFNRCKQGALNGL